uniref:Uncharacterized protein n=1 Tax=uncultured bacterium A1Q1_fos_1880 TaxID=1256556 RepID=L7VZC1_9BACT|nr:hypothetical protein [uncultured bacterium A1Q1_fos_1880]
MTELSAQQQRLPLWSLWFGLMGGPVVYTLYFLAVYFLGEAACLADLLRYRVLGLEAIAFWVLLLTVVAAAMIGYGAWLAYGNWQQTDDRSGDDGASYAAFMAFVGLWLSGLFTVLTVATGLPALFLVLCDWI